MAINDGGTAYPARVSVNRDTGMLQPHQFGNDDFCTLGMSLRDYFAAQVIGPAFLDLFTGWRQAGEPVPEDWPMGLAIDAYRVADAMLRARTQDASHE